MRFLRKLLWVIGAGALFLPVFPDPPLHSGSYVQDVHADQRGHRAHRSRPSRTNLRVLRRRRPSRRTRRQSATPLAFVRDQRFRAATKYHLRSQRRRDRRRQRPFQNPTRRRHSPGTLRRGRRLWRAAVVVHLQRAPIAQIPIRAGWLGPKLAVQSVADAMVAESPDFWVHVGDVVYPRGDYRFWRAGFFEPFAELLRTSPCYAVIGNHTSMATARGRFCATSTCRPATTGRVTNGCSRSRGAQCA